MQIRTKIYNLMIAYSRLHCRFRSAFNAYLHSLHSYPAFTVTFISPAPCAALVPLFLRSITHQHWTQSNPHWSEGQNVTKVAQFDVQSVRSERRSLSSGKLLDLDLPAVMARLISYEWEGCGWPTKMEGLLTEVFFFSLDLFTSARFHFGHGFCAV